MCQVGSEAVVGVCHLGQSQAFLAFPPPQDVPGMRQLWQICILDQSLAAVEEDLEEELVVGRLLRESDATCVMAVALGAVRNTWV